MHSHVLQQIIFCNDWFVPSADVLTLLTSTIYQFDQGCPSGQNVDAWWLIAYGPWAPAQLPLWPPSSAIILALAAGVFWFPHPPQASTFYFWSWVQDKAGEGRGGDCGTWALYSGRIRVPVLYMLHTTKAGARLSTLQVAMHMAMTGGKGKGVLHMWWRGVRLPVWLGRGEEAGLPKYSTGQRGPTRLPA